MEDIEEEVFIELGKFVLAGMGEDFGGHIGQRRRPAVTLRAYEPLDNLGDGAWRVASLETARAFAAGASADSAGPVAPTTAMMRGPK